MKPVIITNEKLKSTLFKTPGIDIDGDIVYVTKTTPSGTKRIKYYVDVLADKAILMDISTLAKKTHCIIGGDSNENEN